MMRKKVYKRIIALDSCKTYFFFLQKTGHILGQFSVFQICFLSPLAFFPYFPYLHLKENEFVPGLWKIQNSSLVEGSFSIIFYYFLLYYIVSSSTLEVSKSSLLFSNFSGRKLNFPSMSAETWSRAIFSSLFFILYLGCVSFFGFFFSLSLGCKGTV